MLFSRNPILAKSFHFNNHYHCEFTIRNLAFDYISYDYYWLKTGSFTLDINKGFSLVLAFFTSGCLFIAIILEKANLVADSYYYVTH